MREERTDLWMAFGLPGHQIAISTNGFVKKNGDAVMGRGCALQASLRFPELPRNLGSRIKLQGNVPGYITVFVQGEHHTDRLMILPVKHNWWEKANLELVLASANFLNTESLLRTDLTFHVPRLGCGNGRLSWDREVQPLMTHLGDNVVVHS